MAKKVIKGTLGCGVSSRNGTPRSGTSEVKGPPHLPHRRLGNSLAELPSTQERQPRVGTMNSLPYRYSEVAFTEFKGYGHFKKEILSNFPPKEPVSRVYKSSHFPPPLPTLMGKWYLLVITGIFLITNIVRLNIFSNIYGPFTLTLQQTACSYSLSFFLLTCSSSYMLDISPSSVIHVAYAFFHSYLFLT